VKPTADVYKKMFLSNSKGYRIFRLNMQLLQNKIEEVLTL